MTGAQAVPGASGTPAAPGGRRPDPARVAGAPISWGVCEVPGWGRVLPVGTVLGQMAELGLRATELGPPGFLPDDGRKVRALLDAHGLRLVGGFLAVVLHDPQVRDATLAEVDRACRQLADGGADVLVLAAATGGHGYEHRVPLTGRAWATLVATAGAAARVAAGHGLRTTLHPHVGTHVETADEVDRFLADSDVPLCLDTGHLLIGGADPLGLARRHPGRVGHVHLKDVVLEVAEQVRDGRTTYAEAVRRGLYVPLGAGDVPVAAVVDALEAAGYPGWYVLEQDTALPDDGVSGGAIPDPARDTARSLAHLTDTGEGHP